MDQPDPTRPDEEILSAQVIERLLCFDELDAAALAELQADPAACIELHRLRLAEAWLTEPFTTDELGVDAEPGADACPSAEDLFDFGQKLEPCLMSNAHRTELSQHIESCAECAALVQTLADRPPSPLIVVDSPLPELHPEPTPRPRTSRAIRLARGPRPRQPSGLRHIPILVAASLLAILITSGWPTAVLGKSSASFPSPAVMRGTSSLRLVSPHNLLLARSTDLPGLPRLSNILFEVRSSQGDVRYEVYIYDGNSSALQREEDRSHLHRIESRGSDPSTLTLAGPLPIGRYSWEAWAYREGESIPVFLGEMDFRVVSDRSLEQVLMDAGESVEAVKQLDESHFIADARALTRTLVRERLCNLYEAERYLAVTPLP